MRDNLILQKRLMPWRKILGGAFVSIALAITAILLIQTFGWKYLLCAVIVLGLLTSGLKLL